MTLRRKIDPELEARLRAELAAVDAIKAAPAIQNIEPPLHRPIRTLEQRLAFLQSERDSLLAAVVERDGVIRKLLAELDELRARASKGGAASRKYSAADRAKWVKRAREIVGVYPGLSAQVTATQIAREQNLPQAAVRTIRRVLRK